jgi:ankyrin repeat protein
LFFNDDYPLMRGFRQLWPELPHLNLWESGMRLIKSTLFFVLATVQAWGYCSYSSKTGPVKAPLMVAIWQGDIETVAKLLNSGMAVNALVPLDCYDGDKPLLTSPLLNAILAKEAVRFHAHGQNLHGQEMVEFLLDHGADPSLLVQNSGPLHMAASLGDLDSIKALLRHGARVDDRNEGGETALVMAAQRENGPAMIQELVAAGADINALNNLGDNAVMLAAWQHHFDAVKLLVGLGVDACAKNDEGETAIDQAKTNLNEDPGKQEIISFLQEKCGR